jgi:lipopolysaccharide transport system permease protein
MPSFSITHHFDALQELIALLSRHRELTWEMTAREIKDRFAGQAFGILWVVGHPLILIGVYIFLFAIVFKTKIGGTHELPLDYTTYMLAGLIPWLSFQESMSKGATVIVSHANLVKQVVFPVAILPVKCVLASLLTQGVMTVLLSAYVLITFGALPWTFALLPLLFLLQALAMIGISYTLAAIGTYFRDLKEFVQVFSTVGMFLIPIFYLPGWVPNSLKPILYLNPFSYVVWCYQDACYFGRIEHPWAWLLFSVGSAGTFYLGYRVFRKLSVAFGNVL